MPLIFFYFAVQSASTSFASGEVGVGLMVWFNVIVLLIMSPTIKKIHDDYTAQRKAGIEKPVFNPKSLVLRMQIYGWRLMQTKLQKKRNRI